MIRRPPRSTRTDTLFPYTTLFRSSQLGDLNTKCNGWIAAPNRNIDLPYPMQWWTLQLRKFQTPLRITFLSACRIISRHVLPSSMLLIEIYSCYHFWAEESGGLLQYPYLLQRRSEERRVEKECVSTCRSRCAPNH